MRLYEQFHAPATCLSKAEFSKAKNKKIKRQPNSRNAKGQYNQRYQYCTEAWKFGALDKEILRKRIERDPELKRLRELLSVPCNERIRQVVATFVAKHISPRVAEALELQEQIEPMVDILNKLNGRMRTLQAEIDYYQWLSTRQKAMPSDYELKNKIKAKVASITREVHKQMIASIQMRLRKAHGFWGYIRKKYPKLVQNNPPKENT
jgi:hypothetical protein